MCCGSRMQSLKSKGAQMVGYGYEVDFLLVGSGDKGGDAIAHRYGEPGSHKVMVIDGGTKESGQQLVDHIKAYYETAYVDYLVNKPPDADHASGLEVVLEQLTISEAWVHRPWECAGYSYKHLNATLLTCQQVRRADHVITQTYLVKRSQIHQPFISTGDRLALGHNGLWRWE